MFSFVSNSNVLAGAVFLTVGGILGLAVGPAGAASADRPGKAQLISVPDSSVVLKLWEDRDRFGVMMPHYSISLDGSEFSEPKATSYTIRLRHGGFDPLGFAPAPALEEGFEAGEDTNLYIVQFLTQPLEEFRGAIEGLGGAVHWYLADHSHIVHMDSETLEAVEELPFVRWVGPYHPAYRLEEFLLDNAEYANEAYPLQKYNVMVIDASSDTKLDAAQRIEEIGGIVDLDDSGKYLLQATLTPEQLFEIIRWDEILFVDRWSEVETDMDIGREIGGANYIEAVGGFTGEGVRGEIIDIGFNVTHGDFDSRPLILHGSVGSDSHGAATSGICFGDGAGDPKARGLLPDGQGIVADWYQVGNRYQHTSELVEDPYYAVFQTSSVGDTRTFDYTTISADMDAMLFDFDILFCQSQSNAGNQDSRPQAWAKNILSGGAAYHYDTINKGDDAWNYGASIGPATDGRIKPDLCFFYDDIYTTTSGGPAAYTSTFGGTSGATPMICGHVGLFFQMWDEGVFNNPVDPSGTVFDNRCHMTTAKAMMINTADQYSFSGTGHDLTRVHQGWGMPDLENMYDLRYKMFIVDESDLLINMSSTMHQVTVEAGEPAMKATLVYADPPGNPSSSQHRINDLTLKVTSPTGTVYWGNHGLLEGMWSTPGGGPNVVDTVENVFIEDPEAGLWTIEIFADEVIEDSHVETPQLDADYALVVSGVEEVLPAMIFKLLSGWPTMLLPDTPVEIEVQILDGEESVVPGSELFYYRMDESDGFIGVPMTPLGDGKYLATVPGAKCDEIPQFYFSVEGDGGTVLTNPPSAPDSYYEIPQIGEIVVAYHDDFETDTGWTVEDFDLEDGTWDRGIPAGGDYVPGDRGDPPTDYDGSGQCWMTDNTAGNSDVDGGPTVLTSSAIDVTVLDDPYISYARWFYNDDGDQDRLDCEISDDGGASWEFLESVAGGGGWQVASFRVADYVSSAGNIWLRFSATDNPNDSVTEAGIDAIEITAFQCEDSSIPADITGDGLVDVLDLLEVLSAWGDCPDPPEECPADITGDGIVDVLDLLEVLSNWT